jgi:para-aminobenzoate synthetase component I
MSPRVYSESWTVRSAVLGSEDFLAEVGSTPFALLHGEGRWIIQAEDPLLVLNQPEPEDIRFERRGEAPAILPDFIGFLGYEYARHLEGLLPPLLQGPLPECYFALYRRVRVFDRSMGLLHEALREGPRVGPIQTHSLKGGTFTARKVWDSDSPEQYYQKVETIRQQIKAGNVYQVNLTRQERWVFQGDLTELARRLSREEPAAHSAFIVGPDFSVISSSPESFLRIHEGRIITRPIKGTAPRDVDSGKDRGLAEGLLASEKNRSELAMITDLLRNDLTRICKAPSVRVEAFPVLESFARVHHLVATVSGEVRHGTSLRELLQATFPGGSITGCPKLAAMTCIRWLEDQPRSVYTGALGWFNYDLSQLDLAIAIRTAWTADQNLWFGVGGGIVWDSEPRDEYLETVHKGGSLVRCLS